MATGIFSISIILNFIDKFDFMLTKTVHIVAAICEDLSPTTRGEAPFCDIFRAIRVLSCLFPAKITGNFYGSISNKEGDGEWLMNKCVDLLFAEYKHNALCRRRSFADVGIMLLSFQV